MNSLCINKLKHSRLIYFSNSYVLAVLERLINFYVKN